MAARTDIQTLSGATISLSATLPATYDAAGYGATGMTYTELSEVEDHGSHGMRANIVTFTNVKSAVVQKIKGAKDYGTKTLTLGYVPGNAGQALALTASESQNRYSAKITYPVGNGEATAEIHYLDVLVGAAEYQEGNVDNVRRLAVDLAICRKPVVVAAT